MKSDFKQGQIIVCENCKKKVRLLSRCSDCGKCPIDGSEVGFVNGIGFECLLHLAAKGEQIQDGEIESVTEASLPVITTGRKDGSGNREVREQE